MSKAEELIAGLHTDGEFDSDGTFSLDREKAREKMRQFQLADPHRYVLLLVEAAVLRGATTILFEIDADDMIMRFDAALDWDDLDQLYTSLFVDRTNQAIRSRRELALACNAAMALNPRWVRIESWFTVGSTIAGVRALLRPDKLDELERIEQAPAEVEAGWTRIHVKERFRPGLLVRFLHQLGDALPEEGLIRERCRLASVAISIDGQRVSYGLPSLTAGVEFEAEGLRGVAGLNVSQLDRSAIVIATNGVELETTYLDDSVPGMWFWVDASSLRKDVSQAGIVRGDPSYTAMLQAIAGARDRVLGKLVELWAAGSFARADQPTSPNSAEVFELLRSCFLRWGDSQWLRPDAGPLGLLADLPLWRTTDSRWLSPKGLLAESERGVVYSGEDHGGILPLGWGPVIHTIGGALESDAVIRVYGTARDVSAELAREVPWERNRRLWRSRPHPPKLPRGAEASSGIDPLVVSEGEFTGELVARPSERSHVRLLVDGCLLCELEFDLGVIGLSAVLAGPFEPASDHTRALADRSLAVGSLALLARIPVMLEQIVELGDRAGPGAAALVEQTLLAIVQPNFAHKWLEAFGFSATAAAQMAKLVGVPRLLPELGLGTDQPSRIARTIRLRTVDQREVSVLEIESDRQQRGGGPIAFVAKSTPPSTASDTLLLWVTSAELALLTAIFGRDQLLDGTAEYARSIGRRTFLAKAKTKPALLQATLQAVVELPEHHLRGVVGVDVNALRDLSTTDQPRIAKVDLLHEGRPLVKLDERTWLPGVMASLEWDEAPVNATWDGLDGSRRALDLRPLQLALETGLITILETCAREAITTKSRPNPQIRRLLWLAIASPFLTVEHAMAWRRLRAAEIHYADAVTRYLELSSLYPTVALAELRETLALLLEDHGVPTREAALDVLARPEPPTSSRPGSFFQRAVLEKLLVFEQVPLVELCSNQVTTLNVLEHNFATNGELAHVHDPELHYRDDEHLIIRADTVDMATLLRLFGPETFKEVSAWIHERRLQERFEQTAPMAEIRVPEHNRLVAVAFEHEGITGELAIPPWHPGDTGLMKLTFCHQRRVVQDLEVHAKQPVIGILDDPNAPLTADFRSVDTKSSRMAVIRKLLDKVLDEQLLPALADAYASFSEHDRYLARVWIIDHWRRVSPFAGSHPNRLAAAGRRFATLPLFEDVDKTPRSLAELSERVVEHGKLWYVPSIPGGTITLPFPILNCRTHEELALVEGLFEQRQDFSPRWRSRADGERNRARARELPSLAAPTNALMVAPIDEHGLRGAVWLADVVGETGILHGSGGKFLASQQWIPAIPVRGVIDGVPSDDGFQAPVLSRAMTTYLEGRAIAIYSAILDQHQADMREPERPDFHAAESLRLRGVRVEWLRRAAIALAQVRTQGTTIGPALDPLELRLEREPLLTLASGRLVSVIVARRARPQELVHLGLWQPDSDSGARWLPADSVQPSDPAPKNSEPTPAPTIDPGLSDELQRLEPSLPRPPEPEPERSRPDPVGHVLERIRAELRLLRDAHAIMLSEGHLDSITADVRNGRELVRIEDAVIFDATHPRFMRATVDADPIWISFLASVAYTGLNRWLDLIEDHHELEFHRQHATYLLGGLSSTPQPRDSGG